MSRLLFEYKYLCVIINSICKNYNRKDVAALYVFKFYIYIYYNNLQQIDQISVVCKKNEIEEYGFWKLLVVNLVLLCGRLVFHKKLILVRILFLRGWDFKTPQISHFSYKSISYNIQQITAIYRLTLKTIKNLQLVRHLNILKNKYQRYSSLKSFPRMYLYSACRLSSQ